MKQEKHRGVDDLPKMVLRRIFGYLNWHSLFQAFQVNKKWAQLAKDDLFWKQLYHDPILVAPLQQGSLWQQLLQCNFESNPTAEDFLLDYLKQALEIDVPSEEKSVAEFINKCFIYFMGSYDLNIGPYTFFKKYRTVSTPYDTPCDYTPCQDYLQSQLSDELHQIIILQENEKIPQPDGNTLYIEKIHCGKTQGSWFIDDKKIAKPFALIEEKKIYIAVLKYLELLRQSEENNNIVSEAMEELFLEKIITKVNKSKTTTKLFADLEAFSGHLSYQLVIKKTQDLLSLVQQLVRSDKITEKKVNILQLLLEDYKPLLAMLKQAQRLERILLMVMLQYKIELNNIQQFGDFYDYNLTRNPLPFPILFDKRWSHLLTLKEIQVISAHHPEFDFGLLYENTYFAQLSEEVHKKYAFGSLYAERIETYQNFREEYQQDLKCLQHWCSNAREAVLLKMFRPEKQFLLLIDDKLITRLDDKAFLKATLSTSAYHILYIFTRFAFFINQLENILQSIESEASAMLFGFINNRIPFHGEVLEDKDFSIAQAACFAYAILINPKLTVFLSENELIEIFRKLSNLMELNEKNADNFIHRNPTLIIRLLGENIPEKEQSAALWKKINSIAYVEQEPLLQNNSVEKNIQETNIQNEKNETPEIKITEINPTANIENQSPNVPRLLPLQQDVPNAGQLISKIGILPLPKEVEEQSIQNNHLMQKPPSNLPPKQNENGEEKFFSNN